jgi:hypothetical protein
MDKFHGNGSVVSKRKKQTWVSGDITTERLLENRKDKITVDVPLNDSYDSNIPVTQVFQYRRYTYLGLLSQIGIEDLRIVSPAQSVTISEGHHRPSP